MPASEKPTIDEPPTVSVVIPTHQRAGELSATIAPLLGDPALHELIVVNDGSTDTTAELLERLAAEHPRLRPITVANQGQFAACLTGVRAASGELVLLLDDDVVAEPGLIAGHARHHQHGRGLVVLGYMPVLPVPIRAGDYPRRLYARAYEQHIQRWEAHPDTILRSLWAGNLSLRRADYLTVAAQDLAGTGQPTTDEGANSKDDDLRGYHQDLDLGLRLRAAGLVGVFDRKLRALHHYQRSPEAFLRDARSSGATIAHVYRRHPGELGSLRADFATVGLPAPARWLIRHGTRSAWPRRLLFEAIPLLGRARLYAGERIAANLLKRIEQQRAASAATAEE